MVHHVSFLFGVPISWFNLYLFRHISTERGSLRRGACNSFANTVCNHILSIRYYISLYMYIYILYIIYCISDNFVNTPTSLTSLTASCTQQDDETCESHTFLGSSPALWMAEARAEATWYADSTVLIWLDSDSGDLAASGNLSGDF